MSEGLARRLHDLRAVFAVLALVLATAGGCVIPPQLDSETPDAGANAPPIVVSVLDEASIEYPTPDPKTFVRGEGEASVTVYDVDSSDTLYVQFFVDYRATDPTPPRSPLCRSAPSTTGELTRTIRCDVRGLCTAADVMKPTHFLEVEVYDREPGRGDTPLYRDVKPPGERSARAYLMTCTDPSPV